MRTKISIILVIVLSMLLLACNLTGLLRDSEEPSDEAGQVEGAEEDEVAQSEDEEEQVFQDEEDEEMEGYYVSEGEAYPAAALCTRGEPAYITDLDVYQTPQLDEPEPRTAFRDPVFGTCMFRVTDRNADISPDDSSRGIKNEYSRVQSFNADGSRFIARSIDAHWYVYDSASLQPLGEIPIEIDPRWDGQDPDLIYFSDETRLMSYDLRRGTRSTVHEFADDFPGQNIIMVWTRYEGSPSIDTRYWGLMAQDEEWNVAALLVYDLGADEVIAVREIPSPYSIDAVTISPLGTYFLAYFDDYCEQGQLGSDSNPCGLMVYDRNLQNGRSLLRIVGHSDTALDADGREVLIYQDIDTDDISMLDLASGEVTPLWSIDFSHTGIGFHFSGRAFDSPGWALASTYNGGYPTDHTWMDDVIIAIELKADGRVVRLAHTQSLYDENMEQDYWAEPHVSVNMDFTRVVFTSNWGRTGTEEVDMYMMVLPEGWLDRLP
ncbi:MAG: hypothetical protein MUO76_24120 [Anaerolineaceae bacterium]|nr:hypothetical protein [Anaerolineaceae bacterium]